VVQTNQVIRGEMMEGEMIIIIAFCMMVGAVVVGVVKNC
jgi:hypothetical protein